MERFTRLKAFARSLLATLVITVLLAAGHPAQAQAPVSTDAFNFLVNYLTTLATPKGDEMSNVDVSLREERIAKLEVYFSQWDLPAAEYAEAFVIEAEKYPEFDWRLVPAIAMLESTGFKNGVCRNGNVNGFGWGSCNKGFAGFESAIAEVTRNLAGHDEDTDHWYPAGSSVEKIMRTYNPPTVEGITPGYHKKIFSVMNAIDSIEVDIEVTSFAVANTV